MNTLNSFPFAQAIRVCAHHLMGEWKSPARVPEEEAESSTPSFHGPCLIKKNLILSHIWKVTLAQLVYLTYIFMITPLAIADIAPVSPIYFVYFLLFTQEEISLAICRIISLVLVSLLL